MNKSASRELAFKVLYSVQMQKDMEEEQFEFFCMENDITESTKKYIQDILFGIKENEEKINNLISTNLKQGWNIERISKIDLALLKIAVYEIIEKKIHYKIIVNEVVELAKKYSDDSSPSFINGILASIIKQNNLLNEEQFANGN